MPPDVREDESSGIYEEIILLTGSCMKTVARLKVDGERQPILFMNLSQEQRIFIHACGKPRLSYSSCQTHNDETPTRTSTERKKEDQRGQHENAVKQAKQVTPSQRAAELTKHMKIPERFRYRK